jgi:hypothetical protein
VLLLLLSFSPGIIVFIAIVFHPAHGLSRCAYCVPGGSLHPECRPLPRNRLCACRFVSIRPSPPPTYALTCPAALWLQSSITRECSASRKTSALHGLLTLRPIFQNLVICNTSQRIILCMCQAYTIASCSQATLQLSSRTFFVPNQSQVRADALVASVTSLEQCPLSRVP